MTSAASHLHFVQSVEPLEGGGLGRAAVDLHRSFRRAGADSRLVATHGGSPQFPGGEEIKEFRRTGPSKAYYAPGLRRDAGALVEPAAFVHAHGFYTAANWIVGRAARRLDRTLVAHVHGFFEPWILGRSRARKRLAHWLYEDANFRAARLWRALTTKEADQIRACGISAPIVVAPNGVDLEAFEAADPAVGRSSFAAPTRRRLLFLARLHPKKGLGLLVPAWAAATRERRDWELVVAGPDELGHRAEIETLATRLGLADSVRFVGTVGGADKVALLRSADAFILPSFSEGFSVAILEAMACGRPVAATHECNFPELASDGGGWLCPAEAGAMRRLVAEVLDTPRAELDQRGLTARRLIEERFTWPAISRILLDACRSLP